MVKVWAEAAEEVNEILLNSLPGRFVPANVIVPPIGLVKVTVPVPGVHEADVDAFVQVPVTVQVDVPVTTSPPGAPPLGLPLTTTAAPFPVRPPQLERV